MIFGLFLLFALSEEVQTLKAGDKIELSIFGYPEISGSFPIEDDGTVYLPLVGKIKAENLTHSQFREVIQGAYMNFLVEPKIFIKPLHRVTILGKVSIPGTYYISETESITDLIAKAGGLREKADLKRINIIRQGKKYSIKKFLKRGKTLSDVKLYSGDIITIPKSFGIERETVYAISSIVSTTYTLYLIYHFIIRK